MEKLAIEKKVRTDLINDRGSLIQDTLVHFTSQEIVVNSLKKYGRDILWFSEEDFINHGLGPTRAKQLVSAIHLILTLMQEDMYDYPIVRRPEDAANHARPLIGYSSQEHLLLMCLDTKSRITYSEVIFKGGLNTSYCHPREILKTALKNSAFSIIVSHNHPSCSPAPSPDDIEATKKLNKACDAVGIKLLDHIIVTPNSYASLADKGYL